MKKILFAALAALAITSCTQNEEIEAPSQKAEINFRSVVGKSSRAVDTNNSNFKAFTINSYITDSKYLSGTLPDAYMDKLACTGGQSNWKLGDETVNYYWPSNKVVNFFAYSTLVTDTLAYTKGVAWPTLTFKMASTTENLRDVVVACATGIDNTSSSVTDGKLALSFNHILTKINFSVKYEDTDYTYTITSIKIKGVKPEGTYTYQEDVTKGTWVASGTPNTDGYSYPINSSLPEVGGDGYIQLDATHGSIIAIPQELAGVTIEVNYSTKKGETEFFNGTKTVAFTTEKWDTNKNIRYKLILPVGATKIKVDTNVGTWGTEEFETPSFS